jgi:hypothetical protein
LKVVKNKRRILKEISRGPIHGYELANKVGISLGLGTKIIYTFFSWRTFLS